jgi:hypothetical protein
MAANGAPGVLSPLVVLTEVGGTIAIIPGWKTRIASILLARLSLLAALLFHHNFADRRPGPDTHVPKGLFHRGSIPDPRRARIGTIRPGHTYIGMTGLCAFERGRAESEAFQQSQKA